MKNTHGRTCKRTKVYIYLYISLYENLFENGYIYIYIYIYLYIVLFLFIFFILIKIIFQCFECKFPERVLLTGAISICKRFPKLLHRCETKPDVRPVSPSNFYILSIYIMTKYIDLARAKSEAPINKFII